MSRKGSTHHEAERASLTDTQRGLYWEARDCGATHADAMEAALTDGYTK